MKNTESSSMDAYASDDISEQNLRQANEHLRLTNQMLWSLFADISKKMQVSSTAIKASVSSLLGYDIVLGLAAQHELLEIIENSTDQVSKNIMLLTLVSKMESNTFAINPEPIEIPEILSSVNEIVARNHPELSLGLSIHTPGKPACIDYEYLSIALVMLYELIIQTQQAPCSLNIAAVESEDHWFIDIEEVSKEIFDTLLKVSASGTDELLQDAYLLPTKKLQLYVVCKIFERLAIQIATPLASETEGPTGIRLMIPIAKNKLLVHELSLNCE
ncbi:hypothetical protein ACFLYO_01255 [Chloroflexota bacterium]